MNQYTGCGKNEKWVGNTPANERLYDLDAAGIKYRIGKVALDIHGRKLDPNYMRPLFVRNESYDKYNRVMQAQVEAIRRS